MATPALQRPYRGSRVSSFYSVKSLPSLSSLDSAFQLQEYISLLIRLDVHDVDTIVALPGKPIPKESDERVLDSTEDDSKKPDDGERKSEFSVDRACWIYEQLRRLAQDLSHPLITMLQQECTRNSCSQMKAGEWLYLCVAHGNDGAMEQCCAIDYILHTVDSATALLNSPRAFPSRLSIPQMSHRHFASLARRLGRIFAHAYFHHRETFEQAEAESSLYARFLKLTSQFELVPAEFLVIPESAVHHDGRGRDEEVEPPRLLAAAVHPPDNFQNNTLTVDQALPVNDTNYGRGRSPTGVDNASHIGTDSPRRPGRSRTDTMVFSEAYNIAEELSKGESGNEAHGGSLLSASPTAEPESFASEQLWRENQARTEESAEEDIDDARTESTSTGSLSPPVEELPLILLEETSNDVVATKPAISDGISELVHLPQDPVPETPTVHETVAEEPAPVEPTTVGSQPTEEPSVSISISDAGEVTPEEEQTGASDPLPELSENPPPNPEEVSVESSSEEGNSMPSSPNGGPQEAELRGEPELSPRNELLLDLNEPPPSEPIPPESESDITDEVNGLDGDEVREGGGDGEVTGE
ncbi:Mob1/phocein [Gyrodon lividus]|nr:Mob1/phocein [Gyrodon lividus]